MDTFIFWFGLVANVITVLAGLIAIAGVVWAIFSRAKVSFSAYVGPSLTPMLNLVATSVGSNPIRNLALTYGAVDDSGFSAWGTGELVSNPLNRGSSILVNAFDEATTQFGSPARDDEIRVGLKRGNGLFVTFQWQSPLLPWRTRSVTYAWPPHLRFAGAQPERLTGRAEIVFLERTRNPKLSAWAGKTPTLVHARRATDATFDSLVREHSGPVVVGLGPSWQHEFWEDVQRMLNAFAAKYAPSVLVLKVTTDENPSIARRYTEAVFPRFVLLREGDIQASQDGVSSMAELESAFEPHLR